MDRKQKLVIAEIILLCLIVLGSFVNILLGFNGFLAYESACTILFFTVLYMIKKEFKDEYVRYFAYFIILLALVLYAVVALINVERDMPRIDLFLFLILALVVINTIFRVILGKREVSGIVLLSDKKLAVVEIPFDLFAGVTYGKYVVETNRKLKKGQRVNVQIKRSLYRRTPERVI